jgi:hypothetical protein
VFDGFEVVVLAKLTPVIRQLGDCLPEALHQRQRSLPLQIVLDHEYRRT